MSKKANSQKATDGTKDRHQEGGHAGRLKTRAQALLPARQNLPIWQHANSIRKELRESHVLLLVGETGSGKSTQVPQFLYNERWCRRTSANLKAGKKVNVGGCIAITQPRRVAAISLAKRVAEEVGTPLGNSSPAAQVGYSVRFDNSTGPSTRIKFLTDGMLLQELLRDPWLSEYSCVVVDEVHERGVNVDLLVGFLKRIVEGSSKEDGRGGVPLKIVIMSATADMEKIRDFWVKPPLLNASSDTTSKEENGGDMPSNQSDDNGWNGFSDHENDENRSLVNQEMALTNGVSLSIASIFIKGRQYPVQTSYAPRPVDNVLDAAMARIIHLHTTTPLPGDILVFLSGQEMIENLESLCQTYAASLLQEKKVSKKHEKLPQLLILPLFAALPTHMQQRVFQPTPPFTRKIILSTDIAETSVTVAGVRHVIDTGKHKSRHFRPTLGLDTLLTGPISRSSAAQRAGRAGREAPGTCYRLYTQEAFYKLEQDTLPEILQTDLSFLVLTLKSRGVEDVLEFPFLTPPPRKSLNSAVIHLLQLGALDADTGTITEIGRKMSMLPLRVDLGRILLASTLSQYDCVEEVIDIVATLSLEEGIWLPLHNQRNHTGEASHNPQDNAPSNQGIHDDHSSTLLLNESEKSKMGHADANSSDEETTNPILSARQTLFRRSGDHLTLLAAVQAYSSPMTHDRKEWCKQHGVSHRAMSRIMDVRKQLRKMVIDDPKGRFRLDESKHSPMNKRTQEETDSASRAGVMLDRIDLETRILKCLLTGLWPNIATISGSTTSTSATAADQHAPYTTLLTRQPLHLHPSSFLFNHMSTSGPSGRSKKSKSRPASRPGLAPTIMFTDFIYTAKPYARNVSVIEMKWMDELGLG